MAAADARGIASQRSGENAICINGEKKAFGFHSTSLPQRVVSFTAYIFANQPKEATWLHVALGPGGSTTRRRGRACLVRDALYHTGAVTETGAEEHVRIGK